MPRRGPWLLTIVACLAAAGCGGSSSSTTTTVTTAPGGQVRYEALGVSFLGPHGLAANRQPFPGVPAGTPFVRLTPGGVTSTAATSEVFIIVNSNPADPLPVVVTKLQASESANPNISQLHSSVATVTVPGARDARAVTESYVSPISATPGSPRTTFHRTFLLMITNSGKLIDMAAVTAPDRGGSLDPAAVIGSVRLIGS